MKPAITDFNFFENNIVSLTVSVVSPSFPIIYELKYSILFFLKSSQHFFAIDKVVPFFIKLFISWLPVSIPNKTYTQPAFFIFIIKSLFCKLLTLPNTNHVTFNFFDIIKSQISCTLLEFAIKLSSTK